MTHSDHTGPLGAHGECWNLLPWIANESAAAKDVARVEAHLRDCHECQEELEFQRQLRNAIRTEEEIGLVQPTARAGAVDDKELEIDPAAAVEPIPLARHEPARWTRWLPIAAAIQGIA